MSQRKSAGVASRAPPPSPNTKSHQTAAPPPSPYSSSSPSSLPPSYGHNAKAFAATATTNHSWIVQAIVAITAISFITSCVTTIFITFYYGDITTVPVRNVDYHGYRNSHFLRNPPVVVMETRNDPSSLSFDAHNDNSAADTAARKDVTAANDISEKFYNDPVLISTNLPSDPTHHLHFSPTSSLSFPFDLSSIDTSFTFSCWVYFLSLDGMTQTIFTTEFYNREGISDGMRFYIENSGGDDTDASLALVLSTMPQSNSYFRTPLTPNDLPTRTWIPIGVTLGKDGRASIYINGAKIADTSSSSGDNNGKPISLSAVLATKPLYSLRVGRGRSTPGMNAHVALVSVLPYRELTPAVMSAVSRYSEAEWMKNEGRLEWNVNGVTPTGLKLFTCWNVTTKDDAGGERTVRGSGTTRPGRFFEDYSSVAKAIKRTRSSLSFRRGAAEEYVSPGGFRYQQYVHGNYTPGLARRDDEASATSRKSAVREVIAHVWHNYEKHAFGKDELRPLSHRGDDRWGGMGMTLLDSLDTLYLVGLTDEFRRAVAWVETSLSLSSVPEISFFETCIRALGGLLAAWDLSGEEVLLRRADELGGRMMELAFQTASGVPYNNIVLGEGLVRAEVANTLAQVGTLQLEYRYLARVTGKEEYATAVERIVKDLGMIQPENGLFPFQLDVHMGKVKLAVNGIVTFGANGDSFYEYLLKAWLQGGRKEEYLRYMYDKAVDGMHELLVHTSTPSGLTYIAEMSFWDKTIDHKMDHLVCFMGATLALGAYTHPAGLESEKAQRDLKTAKALTYTCYQMYARTKTGLSPELIRFTPELPNLDYRYTADISYYILRPETVESFFVLYQLTGDNVYRDWGWEIFQSIVAHCITDGGFGAYKNIERVGDIPEDRMESFFVAETLKYLYLLFDDDAGEKLDLLNKNVLTTEAHPLTMLDEIDVKRSNLQIDRNR